MQYVEHPLKPGKFLKTVRSRFHVSFKGFGMRWKVPSVNEVEQDRFEGTSCCPYLIGGYSHSFDFNGLELYYLHTKERFVLMSMRDYYGLRKQYQVMSALEMLKHENPSYRFIAVLDHRTTKNELMVLSITETNKGILKALNWRLNRMDKQ